MISTATMTHQPADEGQASSGLPVRSLVACRLDSTSTVSTLSFGSEFFDEPGSSSRSVMGGRTASIPRLSNLERFKSSTTTMPDRGLGKAPGRKGSIHRIIVSDGKQQQDGTNLPPRIPSRQDTADRKMVWTTEAEEDDDSDNTPQAGNNDEPTRGRGLNRASGGINVFRGA